MIAWRLAAWDTPFWISANRREGRFNPPFVGPVQYWSLHPLTPWAEYLRAEGIRSVDRLRMLRVRLWAANLPDRCERIGFAEADNHGLAPEELVADDHAPCQQFGEECLGGRGPAAIEVPSAALPGTRNVVLFGERIASPFGLVPIDPSIDVPTTVAAEDGHPLAGLLPYVRHRGDPHAELEAWRRGAPFDPPPIPTPHI